MFMQTLARNVRGSYVRGHETFPLLPPTYKDLVSYQNLVTDRYKRAPAMNVQIHDSYIAFMRECIEQFNWMRMNGVVVEFEDDDPTPLTENGAPSFKGFVEKVEQEQKLRVYRSEAFHPILDQFFTQHLGRWESYNSIFRAVHDFFGHLVSGGKFTWKGEMEAYYSHAEMFSETAIAALFSETVAQNAWYAVYKSYAPQKCVYYDSAWYNPPLT